MKLAALALCCQGAAYAVTLEIQASGGNVTSSLQYGIMFEEINHSGDGGLYGELLQNRAFQADSPSSSQLSPWTPVNGAVLQLTTNNPLSPALTVSVTVNRPHSGLTPIGIANPGYFGIAVLPQTYTGSFWVYGTYTGQFVASLSSLQTGQVFASTNIPSGPVTDQWTQYNFTLEPTIRAPDAFNQFSLTFDSNLAGPLSFNLISLFPPTWHDRKNGMRMDLMNNIAALKPSFLRFPGGSNLLGLAPPSHWRWQDTIGPLNNRSGYAGAWQYENTNGMGLGEFMDWCEDLNMSSILAIWAGEYINGETISGENLQAQIQDALNEIEYVTGPPTSPYGQLRASHGRTEPWQLDYVEIGNEDYASSYDDTRWPAFYSAINQKYPDLNIMSSSPYNSLANQPNATKDFHLYSRPDNLVLGFNYFDQYSRDNKVLIGELANLQYNDGNPYDAADFNQPHIVQPFWAGSVAEAVYMLGLERNTDVILGTTFFSLLENFISSQWSPGLIRFDADPANTMQTTSYEVFHLFSNNRFAETLPMTVTNGGFGPAYWVAGKGGSHDRILKAAVYNSTSSVPFVVNFQGIAPGSKANLTVLTAPDPFSMVSLRNNPVQQKSRSITSGRTGFRFSLPPLSVGLLTIN